jgi:hypothetical protein
VKGGVNVLISEPTAKGEPIIVGVRDGQVRTMTPYNDREGESGLERAARQIKAAIDKRQKVYVRDASIAAAIQPTATGGRGTVPQRQGLVSRGANLPYPFQAPDQQVGWRPPRNVLTVEKVINTQGRVLYQAEPAPFYSAVERAVNAATQVKRRTLEKDNPSCAKSPFSLSRALRC